MMPRPPVLRLLGRPVAVRFPSRIAAMGRRKSGGPWCHHLVPLLPKI